MQKLVSILLTLLLFQNSELSAQLAFGMELGIDQIDRIAARNSNGVNTDARPTQTWPLSLRAEYGGSGPRLGIAASLVNPGLEFTDAALTVQVRPAYRVATLAPEISTRLARLHGAGMVRAHLSIPIERWSFPGLADEPRWRAGVAAGVAVELPVLVGIAARVSGSVGRMLKNPLTRTEITEDFSLTDVWRGSLRLGLRWQP